MSRLFNVTDVFHITGRGCVVHVGIQEGIFHFGDTIKILRNSVVVGAKKIAGIEIIIKYRFIRINHPKCMF